MIDKKWTISLILIFLLFIYIMSNYVVVANKIQATAGQMGNHFSINKPQKHFVLIAQELDNPYWRMVEKGAIDAAKLYGVTVEYEGPLRTNMGEQIKLLEKAIAARVDGIIVQGLNDDAFTPVINRAIEKEIPVITIDTDSPHSKRITYVGTDNFEAGKHLGHAIVQQTEGKGNVGIIIGSDKAESQLLRLKGLRSVLEKFPDIRVIEVRSSNISRIQAVYQAEEMLKKHDNINIMAGTSALDAVGILQAVKNLQKEKKVQIFGFDSLEETLNAIEQGEMAATVAQKPNQMGYEAIRLLMDYLNEKSLPQNYYTDVQIISQSNVELE